MRILLVARSRVGKRFKDDVAKSSRASVHDESEASFRTVTGSRRTMGAAEMLARPPQVNLPVQFCPRQRAEQGLPHPNLQRLRGHFHAQFAPSVFSVRHSLGEELSHLVERIMLGFLVETLFPVTG